VSDTQYRAPERVSGWVGWIAFAGVLMIMAGIFQAIWGLVAIFRNEEVFFVGEENLPVEVDYSAWGWAHLTLGILLAITGYALMRGQTWARVVTVVLAILSAVANLLSIGAYPLWSTIIIALAVLIIYAVVVHGSEARAL
jgi:hypothetical protein